MKKPNKVNVTKTKVVPAQKTRTAKPWVGGTGDTAPFGPVKDHASRLRAKLGTSKNVGEGSGNVAKLGKTKPSGKNGDSNNTKNVTKGTKKPVAKNGNTDAKAPAKLGKGRGKNLPNKNGDTD